MTLLSTYIPKSGEVMVGASGPLDAPLCAVGEAPAAKEVAKGEPLVGPSGQEWNSICAEAGAPRPQWRLTNLFKFEIKKRKSKGSGEIYYHGSERLWDSTNGFTDYGMESVRSLMEELKLFKGHVIMPLGNASLFALTGETMISKWRGSILWSEELEKKIIPTYHPAYIIRGNYPERRFIIHDIMRAKAESRYPEIKEYPHKLLTFPSYIEVITYLEDILKNHLPSSFDIEVWRDEVSCLSIAKSPNISMSIPFVWRNYNGKIENYWDLEQEREIWILIARILESPVHPVTAQNSSFDISYLFHSLGIQTQAWEDTMIAHKMIFPEFRMGLDVICSTYTRFPYYKDEGKKELREPQNWETYFRYNARDSLVCQIAMPQLLDDLERLGNLEAYREQAKLIGPITYMANRGMRVNHELLQQLSEETDRYVAELKAELHRVVGYDLNHNSPDQVKNYFYQEQKIKPYVEKGKPTVNAGALVRIARRGYEAAHLIMKLRHASKMNSTYFKMKLKPYPDGPRLTTSYSPITAFDRLSSRKDLQGYGMNMQNQPKSMNIAFLADPGHLIFNMDLSQADARSVAYIGNVTEMIEAFENNLDIHSMTASKVFGIPVDEIIAMNKEGVKAPIGYEDQTHRYWGKKCNHSLNFGISYVRFSYLLEIPEAEGKMLIQKYHQAYPGVQKGYHETIKKQLRRDRIVRNCFGRGFLFFQRWGDDLFKDAYAAPAQSNTADVVNRHGLNPFYYEPEFSQVDLLRQVHDSINFQLPLSLGVDKMAALLLKMRSTLEQPLQWADRSFVIPTDWSAGYNLGDKKDSNPQGQIDLDLTNPENLKAQLRQLFTENPAKPALPKPKSNIILFGGR